MKTTVTTAKVSRGQKRVLRAAARVLTTISGQPKRLHPPTVKRKQNPDEKKIPVHHWSVERLIEWGSTRTSFVPPSVRNVIDPHLEMEKMNDVICDYRECVLDVISPRQFQLIIEAFQRRSHRRKWWHSEVPAET